MIVAIVINVVCTCTVVVHNRLVWLKMTTFSYSYSMCGFSNSNFVIVQLTKLTKKVSYK